MRNFRLRFFIVFVLLLSLVTGFSYVSGKYVMTTDSFNLNLDVKANFYVTFDANGGVLENPVESDDTWSIETENSKPIRATKVYMPKNACYSDKEPQAIGTIPSVSRYGYNFLGWSFANVPYGYQEVEYLTSDGNQYIDLPYGFNSTDEIEIKAALDNISQDKYLVAKKSWTSNDRFLMVGGFSGFGIGYGDKPTNATDFVTKINQTVSKDKNVHTWTYANKVFKITDLNVEIDVSSSYFSENETSDIRLFYGYYSNTAGTIYSFHQKKADGREIKLVPAEWSGGKTTYSKNNVTYENSELAEGTLGLYDKTNGMFYINSGKGTFTRGKYVNSDNEDDEFINASSILEDATDYIFYASWQKKSYTVTLYNNDETGSTRAIGNENGSQINVNYGETYYKLPNVSRTGYEFKGWFDIDGKEYIKDEIVDIEEDIDLYAKWLANTYTVSLDAAGGEIDSKTKNIKFDDKYGELPTPTRKGYDFLGWLESRVPLSFEELEYISSTGNGQYIELPFGFDSTDEIKLTAAIDLSGDRYIVAPAKWNNNNNRFALGGVYQGLYTIGYGNYSTSLTHLGPTHTIDTNKHLWTYKDYLFEMPELNLSFDVSNVLFGGTTDKIRLFFGYNSPMSGKIYSYYHKKVVNGKEEEINLVPIEWKGGNVVYSKNGTETKGELPSGTVGFYDTLNDVLYINSGSNTLTGGDAVKPLTDYVLENTLMSIPNNHALIADWTPHKYNLTFDANGGTITYPSETDDVWKEVSNTSVTKYIRIEEKYGELPTVSKTGYSFEGWYNAQSKNEYFVLDYIQSDGTQIINTGYKPTNKTAYEIKYSGYEIPTANSEHILFGAGNSWLEVVGVNNSKNGTRSNTIPYVLYDGVNSPLAQQSEATYYLDSTGLYVNGSATPAFAKIASEFDWTTKTDEAYSISIFGVNKSWNAAIKNVAMKLHYFKIFEDGILVFNGVPSYYNNKYGLYDTVNKQFYTNVTGNEFKGSNIKDIKQITSDDTFGLTEDQVLYSKFTPKHFTLTLDTNDEEFIEKATGNTLSGTLEVIYDSTYKDLPTLSLSGCEFLGWYDDKQEGNKIEPNSIVKITEDKTLYAHYSKGRYTVTLDANCDDLENPEPITVTYASKYENLPTLERNGYDFVGWSGFEILDYIQSDGTQIINTGYKPTNKTAYEIKYSGYEIPTANSEHILFGAGNSWLEVVGVNNSKNGTRSNTIPYVLYDGVNSPLAQQSEATYYLDSTGLYVNGSATPAFAKIASEFDWTTKTDEAYSISIFGVNKSWNAAIKNVAMKLHYFKIFEDGILVFNGVPSYYNNKYGLYDTVNKQFYTNTIGNEFTGPKATCISTVTNDSTVTAINDHYLMAIWTKHKYNLTFDSNGGIITSPSEVSEQWIAVTSTSATKQIYNGDTYGDLPTVSRVGYSFDGWDESNIPSKYQRLEYIESTGNQYIDTEYKIKSNNVEIKTAVSNYSKNGMWAVLYGVRSGSGKDISLHINDGASPQYANEIEYNSGSKGNTGTGINYSTLIDYAEIHDIRNKGNLSIKVNDETYSTEYAGSTQSDRNFYLFAYNEIGTTNWVTKMRMYYFDLYDDGELVRSFVPVKDLETGKCGMYDTANNKFYAAVNGKEFIGKEKTIDYKTSETILNDYKDHTLTACYTPNVYTLTLNPKVSDVTTIEGFVSNSLLVTYDSTYASLPDLSKKGYAFDGWYFDEAYENKCNKTDLVKITENKTLYAKWNKNTYTVSFESYSDSVLDPITVTYDEAYGELPTPEKLGYDFIGWSLSGVPEEYVELEYIESTGSQYIDLDYALLTNDVEVKTKMSNYSNNSSWSVIYGSAENKKMFSLHTNNSTIYHNTGSNAQNINMNYPTSMLVDGIEIDDVRKNGKISIKLNNSEYTGAYDGSVVSGRKVYLFAYDEAGSTTWKTKIRVYYFDLYDDGKLVRSLKPVRTKSEPYVYGMYDSVSKDFFGNAGTNSFTGKDLYEGSVPIVNKNTIVSTASNHTLYATWTPHKYNLIFNSNGGTFTSPSTTDEVWNQINSEYANKLILNGSAFGELPVIEKQGSEFLGWSFNNIDRSKDIVYVPYIESSTGQEKIVTEFIPNIDYEYEITWSVISGTEGKSWCIFGVRDEAVAGTGFNIGNISNDFYGTSSNNRYKFNDFEFGKVYTSNIKDHKLEITCEDELVGSNTYSVTTPSKYNYPVAIAALNNAGTINPADKSTRIYEVCMKDSLGNYIFHMLPVYNINMNEFGLYDEVNDKFYRNVGSGSFTCDEYKGIEYITSNNRFDYYEDINVFPDFRKYVTVKFDIGDGELLTETKNVYVGTAYGQLPTPEKEGYQFVGWKGESSTYVLYDYIENTGNEYIKTNVVPNKAYEYGIEISIAEDSTSYNSYCVMGSRESGFPTGVNIGTYSNDFYGVNSDDRKYQSLLANTKYSMVIKDATLTTTNETDEPTSISFNASGVEQTTQGLYIFALNDKGSPAYSKTGTKLYSAYVKDASGNYLFNFRPAIKNGTEVGLLDIETSNFYTNSSGKGKLKVGGDTNAYYEEVTKDTIMNLKKDHTLTAIWIKIEE